MPCALGFTFNVSMLSMPVNVSTFGEFSRRPFLRAPMFQQQNAVISFFGKGIYLELTREMPGQNRSLIIFIEVIFQ